MEMSFGHRIRETQRLAQSLRLSEEQRLEVRAWGFSLRMELVQAIRGERYEPQGTCPACSRKMTPMEIIAGFNQDPNDFTTRCSGCGYSFEPLLVCFSNGGQIELPFFCANQILAQLPGKETLQPEQFAREHPAIYRSAIVHHGGIRHAFEKVGIVYPFEDLGDWRSKILPFLGRLPDTIIAECVDVSVAVIRRMRQKLGVSRHTLHVTLSDAGLADSC